MSQMMIALSVILFFSFPSFAEVTGNIDPSFYLGQGHEQDVIRGQQLPETQIQQGQNIPEELTEAYETLSRFYRANNRRERYAFINIRQNPGDLSRDYFKTYVVDLSRGAVTDTFASLIGYRGIGCGTGQTRAGIFRLSDASGTGASRKPHWGNNWRYQVMTNIGGHRREWGGDNCGMNYQHVAHSNRHMTDDNPRRSGRRGRRGHTRKSAGCFVTSPDIFNQYTRRLAGNALIYNVDND